MSTTDAGLRATDPGVAAPGGATVERSEAIGILAGAWPGCTGLLLGSFNQQSVKVDPSADLALSAGSYDDGRFFVTVVSHPPPVERGSVPERRQLERPQEVNR